MYRWYTTVVVAAVQGRVALANLSGTHGPPVSPRRRRRLQLSGPQQRCYIDLGKSDDKDDNDATDITMGRKGKQTRSRLLLFSTATGLPKSAITHSRLPSVFLPFSSYVALYVASCFTQLGWQLLMGFSFHFVKNFEFPFSTPIVYRALNPGPEFNERLPNARGGPLLSRVHSGMPSKKKRSTIQLRTMHRWDCFRWFV